MDEKDEKKEEDREEVVAKEEEKKEEVIAKEEEKKEELSAEEINWKKFREKRAQEKEALLKAEKEAAILKNAVTQLIEKERPIDDIEEDDEEKRLKQVIENVIVQKEQKDFPNKLRQAFPDFDKVCTAENIDYLEFHEPELAKALKHMPNTFEKWSTLYSSLKKKLPKMSGEKEKRMMESNSIKPQSSSTPGNSQLGTNSDLSYLSDDKKSQNWQRMQKIISGQG